MLKARRSIPASAVVALALLLVPLSIARANFGSNTASGGTPAHACDNTTDSQCVADSGYHTYFLDGVEANQQDATRWAMNNLYQPISAITVSEGVDAVGKDLIVRDTTYGTIYWAWTECGAEAIYGGVDPSRWCKPQYIRWDLSNQGAWTLTTRQYIACHEIGHTLGLRHSTDTASCLLKNSASSTVLTSHDILHLDIYYGP